MKTKLLLMILLSAIFCACEKEHNSPVPQLSDPNPKVTQISVPGISLSGTSCYFNIQITYQGELISSITRTGDSILFYYTNEQLDSARRFTKYHLIQGGEVLEQYAVSFIKKNGKIIQANFKSKYAANDTIRFRFSYNSDQLATVKTPYAVDSLIYTNGQITDILTRGFFEDQFGGEYYSEIKESLRIIDYVGRPNPYYLISNRLGFPYFSCVWDNAVGAQKDYTRECMSNYIAEDELYGKRTIKLNYDFDNLGRVKAIYSVNRQDKKELIQYQ